MAPQGEAPRLLDEIRRLSDEFLPGRCRLLTVPPHEVPDLLNAADVFVSASLREGFGRAILEAAACAIPALIHDDPHFPYQ